ncbi:MAG: Cell division protein FtsQ [Candidatus Omnitrophica bacterium]|nr:Cell division protein FtsQ [Candidatus Omnitrophota bacterium]
MAKQLKYKVKKKPGFLTFKLVGLAAQIGRAALPYLITVTTVVLLGAAVYGFAKGSPAFELREVRVLNAGTMTAEQAFKFCALRPGENLFDIDLVLVQKTIKRSHPEYKDVLVRRVPPSRIEVELRRRTPVAQVYLSRYVQIDKDRVVLPGSSATPFRNLTIIEGAVSPRGGLYVGSVLADEGTKKAVQISELIKRTKILRQRVLNRISVVDPRNLSLYVDGDVEIRMGDAHFIERLKILDQTLKTIDLDAQKIEYIDLRFDDLVIGPRKA